MSNPLRSLKTELIVVLLAIIGVSGAVSFGASIWMAHEAIDDMVTESDLDVARTIADRLSNFYRDHQSWNGVRSAILTMRKTGHREEAPDRDDELPLIVTEAGGTVVYNGFQVERGDHPLNIPARLPSKIGVPVLVDGRIVGYTYFKTMVLRIYDAREQRFIDSMNGVLALTMGIQCVIALVLGLIMGGRITRPVIRLEAAVKRIAAGQSHDHVVLGGRNEIARLSTHFNQMIDRLAAQEQSRRNLFADVAHELRTPVSIIQANLEMMIEGVYPANKERLSSLYEETRLLTQLIGDLRTISDLELGAATPERERMDLALLVAEVTDRHQARFAEVGIQLSHEGPLSGHNVWADPMRLAQVVGNLLENALKYASTSQTIQVKVTRTTTEKPRSGMILVEVLDEGPGIAADETEKIFERFYRAEQSRNRQLGGRGLGLAICRQVIESFDGRIGAKNRDSGGLCVWFELPVALDFAGHPATQRGIS